MPPDLCHKCRQVPAAEGDAWCYGCAGWEAIGRELTASWDSTGARRLAADLVVNAARQVRALRSLSAGLARETGPPGSAGKAVAPQRRRSREREPERPSLPRRRSEGAVRRKEELESEEEEAEVEESEEDEERRRRDRRSPDPPERDRRGHHRPPEPDGPPPPGTTSISKSLRRADGHHSAGTQDSTGHTKRRRSGHHHEHKPTRRAGRKHKRLKRLAENPGLVVHRQLSQDFLKLATSEPGALDLGRLGR